MRLENHPRTLLWMVIVLAAASIAFAGLWRQEAAYHQATSDGYRCTEVLREIGPAFEKVHARVTSHPRAVVMGQVSTTADLELLRKKIAEAMPERWPHVSIVVRIATATTEPSN